MYKKKLESGNFSFKILHWFKIQNWSKYYIMCRFYCKLGEMYRTEDLTDCELLENLVKNPIVHTSTDLFINFTLRFTTCRIL